MLPSASAMSLYCINKRLALQSILKRTTIFVEDLSLETKFGPQVSAIPQSDRSILAITGDLLGPGYIRRHLSSRQQALRRAAQLQNVPGCVIYKRWATRRGNLGTDSKVGRLWLGSCCFVVLSKENLKKESFWLHPIVD